MFPPSYLIHLNFPPSLPSKRYPFTNNHTHQQTASHKLDLRPNPSFPKPSRLANGPRRRHRLSHELSTPRNRTSLHQRRGERECAKGYGRGGDLQCEGFWFGGDAAGGDGQSKMVQAGVNGFFGWGSRGFDLSTGVTFAVAREAFRGTTEEMTVFGPWGEWMLDWWSSR